jgi:hypothetical protein
VVTEKEVTPLTIASGEAFIAFNKAALQISAEKNALIYRASVPS